MDSATDQADSPAAPDSATVAAETVADDTAAQMQINGQKENESELFMPYDVTNEVSAAGRIDLYRSKPCLFVTTRILVVDMLNARIQGQHIAGMIIMNAHRVTDASGEAFAVRLYRMANKSGFVRAFSDQPTGFASGFNKVRRSSFNSWISCCSLLFLLRALEAVHAIPAAHKADTQPAAD